jgi:glutathione S-transferase
MRLLGVHYEHRPMTAWTHLPEIRSLNPVGRVPALCLEGGEVLFDSSAILDYLDGLVGPERALVPRAEPMRHEVFRVVACAMGALEKIVAALYECTMHPPEKIHQPWLAHNEDQARSGLEWLNHHYASQADATIKLTQAEITTVVMFDFARIVNPQLVTAGLYPALDELARHCDALPAFSATLPIGEVDQSNPALPGTT